MLVVMAEVEIDPANLEAMRGPIAAMERASQAEPGCHEYTLSQEVSDPSEDPNHRTLGIDGRADRTFRHGPHGRFPVGSCGVSPEVDVRQGLRAGRRTRASGSG